MSDAFPLLSIAILADSHHHFLFQTLESLAQQEEKNFEVVVLDAREAYDWINYQSSFPISHYKMEGKTSGAAMNQALSLSRGAYIQFLRPGERLLSRQATSYIGQLATENNCPEIVYGAFLEKDPERPPRAATYPLHLLKQGVAPTSLHAHWFLRSALVSIGGFNPSYTRRPSFDALCALLQNHSRAVYTRRVFVDCERRRSTAAETAGFAFETCKILYRHFGLWHALRWLFVQDRALMTRRLWKGIKNAFLGSA